MNSQIFKINEQLAIGPRPNASEMNQWCAMMAENGIDYVVSLISQEEVKAYGIENEEECLKEYDIGFDSFPIHDYDVPDEEEFVEMMDGLIEKHAQGKNIFLHCAGGVGRAGTLACCLLVAQGMETDDAVKLVSEKRGRASPETKGQIEFVQDYQRSRSNI